jgi:hypothetical protein
MEKSQEKQAGHHLRSFERTDQISKPEIKPDRSSTVEHDRGGVWNDGPIKRWLSLAAYWVREMLWRRKFWQGIQSDQDRPHDEAR